MNPRLADMAEDDGIYKAAAPSLFGEGFCKRAKERDEELRCLNMATTKTSGQARDPRFFSRRPLLQTAVPWEQPIQFQGAKRGLSETAPLQTHREPVVSQVARPTEELTVAKTTTILGTDLPIVMCVLVQTKYLANLMKSPIISMLLQMGVKHVAQRVALQHVQIAGRLHLFVPNWKVITKDPWVLTCIEGYTIDLTEQPTQHQPPQELKFPPHEMKCLT